MRTLPPILLALLLALFLPPAASAIGSEGEAAAAPPGPGALVIIGGGLSADNEAVYRAILDRREGSGPLCVIPAASADPEGSGESAARRLDRWGGEGTARVLPLSLDAPERAQDPEVAAEVARCSGYFFTGGAQSRIVTLLLPDGGETLALRALMTRWKEGAVVSGSSAGAAMMSDPMIAGGPAGGAWAGGASGEEASPRGVQLSPGLGFLPSLLVDQHFLARGRMGRLVEAVTLEGGVPVGAGIDEDTALLVEGSEARVVGRSGVVIVDARGSRIRVELLGPGDALSLVDPEAPVRTAGGRVPLRQGDQGGHMGTPHPGQSEEPGANARSHEEDPTTLFRPWRFLHQVERWGHDPPGGDAPPVVLDFAPGVRWVLRAGPGFRALGDQEGAGSGVAGSHQGLSVGPFLLQVEREP